MTLPQLPPFIFHAAVEAQHMGQDGVGRLLQWWSAEHPETPEPSVFEIFSQLPSGRWLNLMSTGSEVVEIEEFERHGGAAVCGTICVVFLTVTEDELGQSWETRLDGTRFINAHVDASVWRAWSGQALLAAAPDEWGYWGFDD